MEGQSVRNGIPKYEQTDLVRRKDGPMHQLKNLITAIFEDSFEFL